MRRRRFMGRRRRIASHFDLTHPKQYIGDFREDKRNGNGEYYFANGNHYKGGFVNGLLSGKGQIRYSSGESYIGDFKDIG